MRVMSDEPHEDVYDRNGNRLEDANKKLHLVLNDIFDKNGNKLDEKYNDDKSAFQVE